MKGLCIVLELDNFFYIFGCIRKIYISLCFDVVYLFRVINIGSIRIEMGFKSKCVK